MAIIPFLAAAKNGDILGLLTWVEQVLSQPSIAHRVVAAFHVGILLWIALAVYAGFQIS